MGIIRIKYNKKLKIKDNTIGKQNARMAKVLLTFHRIMLDSGIESNPGPVPIKSKKYKKTNKNIISNFRKSEGGEDVLDVNIHNIENNKNIKNIKNKTEDSGLFSDYIPIPKYGNYGQKNYCGGKWSTGNCDFTVEPIDRLDNIFKAHDLAYSRSESNDDFNKADRVLLKSLSDLGDISDLPIKAALWKNAASVVFPGLIKSRELFDIIPRIDLDSITNANLNNLKELLFPVTQGRVEDSFINTAINKDSILAEDPPENLNSDEVLEEVYILKDEL
jgi:hypothetical protein